MRKQDCRYGVKVRIKARVRRGVHRGRGCRGGVGVVQGFPPIANEYYLIEFGKPGSGEVSYCSPAQLELVK